MAKELLLKMLLIVKKHKTLSEQGFGPAKLEDEELILKNGGPMSRPGGTSANKYGGLNNHEASDVCYIKVVEFRAARARFSGAAAQAVRFVIQPGRFGWNQ